MIKVAIVCGLSGKESHFLVKDKSQIKELCEIWNILDEGTFYTWKIVK